jgi:hypothetical protein
MSEIQLLSIATLGQEELCCLLLDIILYLAYEKEIAE